MKPKFWLLTFCGVFFLSQALHRFWAQSQGSMVKLRTQAKIFEPYDIRGFDRVVSLIHKNESDRFRDRVRRLDQRFFYVPGLVSMQTSWTWMEVLNGLHTETAIQNDYSWLFSKLNFLNQSLKNQSDPRPKALAPFFLVIGTDGVGSTLLVRDWIINFSKDWKTWFYAGYHAVENLHIPKLAADYYERSLEFSQTPNYVASLVLKLRQGSSIESKAQRDALLKSLDEPTLERIKRHRPEWFTQ